MSATTFSPAQILYPTTGNLALAAEPQTYLRLVEDAPVLPLHTDSQSRCSVRKAEPQDSRKFAHGLIVSVLAFGLLLASLFLSDALVQSSFDAAASQTRFEEVTVHAGDSLWSLAAEHASDGLTTSQVVRLIEQENSLDSGLIEPGDTLFVPVG